MHSLGGDASTERALASAIQNYCRELNLSKEMRELVQGHLGQIGGAQKGEERGGRKRTKPARGPSRPRSGGADTPPQKGLGREIPTIFRLRSRPSASGVPEVKIPRDGTRQAHFETDAESEFFTRSRAPGVLELKLLNHRRGEGAAGGGGASKEPGARDLGDLISFERSGPEDGEIVLKLKSQAGVDVGDVVDMGATLRCPGAEIEEVFQVRIVEPKGGGDEPDLDDGGDEEDLGLPDLILVAREKRETGALKVTKTWDDLKASGLTMDGSVVVLPYCEDGQRVSGVYVNLDSEILDEFVNEHRSAQELQRKAMLDRYIAAMYLHAVMLAGEIGSQGFEIRRRVSDGSEADADLVTADEFVRSVVAGGYANLVLRFDAKKLMALTADDVDE